MPSRGRRQTISLETIGGKVPVPYLVPYTTSKFAITGLTQALQAKLSAKGIYVHGLYPNLIKIDFLERAIFRGLIPIKYEVALNKPRPAYAGRGLFSATSYKNGITSDDEQARRRQVEDILRSPIIEKPEDVANAVWEAVQHKRDVTVGSANLAVASHHLFPGLMQWIFRKAFRNKDREQSLAS